MNKKIFNSIFCLVFIFIFSNISAQKITYSEPDKDEAKSGSFEIIGRFESNYLIYKSYKNSYNIYVYNAQMNIVEKNNLDFLPDRIINSNFLAYPTFSYMFYQYQKRNIVYSMAVKFDNTGKKISEPLQLDTTDIGNAVNNKIYNIIYSEDKEKIMSYKINNKSDKEHLLKTVLFDKDLKLIQENFTSISLPEKKTFLNTFQLDNDGDLAFLRITGNSQNNSISKVAFILKPINNNQLIISEDVIKDIYLDELSIKIDNYNKRYIVSSFYSKQKRGNIEGLYTFIWDKTTNKVVKKSTSVFTEELRGEARGENSTKTAFNDYFLRNIITKVDGGFIIIAEAVYTSSRSGGINNRWDYYNYPYYGNPYGGGYYNYGYYGGSFGSPWYPWGAMNNFNNVTRYYADNILLLSYDSAAKIDWSNVIIKSQYDDNSDEMLGYSILNTGEDIKFLFNVLERRNWILSEQAIDGEGQITRSPTLKNLEKGYEFMPRYAKQVGAKQIIVPCLYRGYVCFAKIDL